MCVRKHTQDIRGCQCVSVCVCQHTHDVCGCPSVHISARWSLDSARWPFPWTVWVILAHMGCLFSTHRTSVGVRQHTQDVRGCPWLSISTHMTYVAVRVCPSAHTGRPWLSIRTHISTLVLGLSTLALPVDCSGDFVSPGLSVQYTQDVRGCPSAHTGRPCVSVSTHRTFVAVHQYTYQHVGPWTQHSDFGPRGLSVQYTQDVRGYPPAHTGCVWLSVCVHVCPSVSVRTHRTSVAVHHTHRTSVGVHQHTEEVRGCLWLSVSTHRTSVAVRVCPCVSMCVRQYTEDVRWCPSAHTGRPCVSVSTHRTSVAVRVCPSAHTGRPWLSISTHISTLVLGLSKLALPVDCLGDFGPRGLSVQYTQDVRGCPPAHTGRSWLSVSTRRTTHTSTLVLGLSTLALPMDCSGDFGPRGLSIQYTQDFRGTHRTSVAFHQYTYQHVGPWTQHADPSRGLFGTHMTFVCVCQKTQDVCGCPCVAVSTHRTSLAVHLYTYQHVGPWTQHADPSRGLFGTSVAVRVCPSAHTGCSWLSISTHISTLVLGLSTLALPVDCSSDFGPCGLSVQYTQDVRGCPPAHTGRLWPSISTHSSTLVLGLSTLALPVDCSGDFGPRGLSVQYTQDVFECPSAHTRRLCVSVSTHRPSVAVRQHTYQHVGPWTQHAGPSRGLFGTSVAVRHHTQDVRGCLCVSVCLRVCPCVFVCVRQHTQTSVGVRQHTQDVHLCPTHISTLVLGLSMLALPVDCLGDFGQRGLSVHYTQDIRWCPPAHTGHSWLSVPVRQYTQDVRGCLCVSVCVRQHTHRTSVAVHQTHRTSVGVCQHTQDVRVFPSPHTGRPWLSMCVRVCPSAYTGRPWLSISTHISTLVLGLSTLTLPVDCSGDFGPRGLSVQYTQDVRG
ncbi:hypothetical protein YC2023_108579 [Brassica napus]